MSLLYAKLLQSCPALCNHLDCSLPGSSVLGDSPGKNTGVGCHALLQGIFPTQGSNPGLLHCRQILYHLSHQVKFYIIVYNSELQKDLHLKPETLLYHFTGCL